MKEKMREINEKLKEMRERINEILQRVKKFIVNTMVFKHILIITKMTINFIVIKLMMVLMIVYMKVSNSILNVNVHLI